MYSHDHGHLTIIALPNEHIIHILADLRTIDLIPLSTVCKRVHDLVARLLAERLRRVASLHSHSLLLEAYHPTQRLTEPPYPCFYLGTDGLDEEPHSDTHASLPPGQRLRELGSLFSRFRPYRRPIDRINPMKHPAGDIPGSRTYRDPNNAVRAAPKPRMVTTGAMGPGVPRPRAMPAPSRNSPSISAHEPFEPVIQSAHLEAGVGFTQLCVDTTVTIAGPMPGIFMGAQYINKGVLRVFRGWLAERAAADDAIDRAAYSLVPDEDVDGEDDTMAATTHEAIASTRVKNSVARRAEPEDVRADSTILWVGNGHSVGIRFDVRQPRWRPQHSPILVSVDEELPVSYEIEYEELLVRTTDLLLASEKADERQYDSSGKAIVIGNFP